MKPVQQKILRNTIVGFLSLVILSAAVFFWQRKRNPRGFYSCSWPEIAQSLSQPETIIYSSPHAEILVLRIEPDQELRKEAVDAAQILIGVEGKGIVRLRTNSSVVEPNSLTVIPVGAEHTIQNPSDRPLKLYKLFSPSLLLPEQPTTKPWPIKD